MNRSFARFWPWFFFTAAFESLCAIMALLLIPSEGLSPARLGLFAILLVFLGGAILLGVHARRDASLPDRLIQPIFIFTYAAAFVVLTCGLTLFLLRYLNPEQLLPFYERLAPLLWYLLVVAIQAVVFLL